MATPQKLKELPYDPSVLLLGIYWASLIAQLVNNLPAMQETQVRLLGLEDPLEKEMATHLENSFLENSMDKGASQATVHGFIRVAHDLATKPPPYI